MLEVPAQIDRTRSGQPKPGGAVSVQTAIERYKSELGGDGLRILNRVPDLIQKGSESLSPAEKDLLKWVGVFFRKPTPGKFMMRIRMPNGFTSSSQLRVIAELSKRLGNSVLDITTRQQIELRGFTLDSVPQIWEKLRGVDRGSLQTGMDNVRNINGCPLAGIYPGELLDASAVVKEIDGIFVGRFGNPEFTNLPRKLNITVTGCTGNCTHNESQDIALIPARRNGRVGFNVLVGGKMGSGGFTLASPLDVFVEPSAAPGLVVEIVKIFRDYGPREARSKARLAFLIAEWGIARLRAELESRLGQPLSAQGVDARRSSTTSHLGITQQKEENRIALGLCVPAGRVSADQLDGLATLAETYGQGQIRLTTGQNAILPDVPARRVGALLQEPLLKDFSPSPSPFFGGLVACVGTEYCNLALIETKQRAQELSSALEKKLGTSAPPLSIHWSGCPAGCGNHQAADIGFRGFKTKIDGKLVDAVAIYAGGKTGPNAVSGQEILASVPCDENLPEVVASVIETLNSRAPLAETVSAEPCSMTGGPFREIVAVIRPEKWLPTVAALRAAGVSEITQQRVCGRGQQSGLRYVSHAKGPSTIRYLSKRMLHIHVEKGSVDLAVGIILSFNRTGSIGDGKIFVLPSEEVSVPVSPQPSLHIPEQLPFSGGYVATA